MTIEQLEAVVITLKSKVETWHKRLRSLDYNMAHYRKNFLEKNVGDAKARKRVFCATTRLAAKIEKLKIMTSRKAGKNINRIIFLCTNNEANALRKFLAAQ